jgi:hypothetical protein
MPYLPTAPRLLAAVFTASLIVFVGKAEGQRTVARPGVARSPASIRIEPLPPTAVALRGELSPLLAPTVMRWIQEEARKHARRSDPPDATLGSLRRDVVARFPGQRMSESDIMAIVSLVMAQLAEEMEADLQEMVSTMDSANKEKQKGRRTADSVKQLADSLSGSAEGDMLELQSLIQRRSKVLELISNLVKKISGASTQILSNLK